MTNWILTVATNTTTTPKAGAGDWITMIGLVVFWGVLIYFMFIRPQKKQQKAMAALQASIQPGDSIVTTSGFYGTVIVVEPENSMVIVEFGNNKNCRIPMQMAAIAEVEKVNDSKEEGKEKTK